METTKIVKNQDIFEEVFSLWMDLSTASFPGDNIVFWKIIH